MAKFTVVVLSEDYLFRYGISNLLRLATDKPKNLQIYTASSPEAGLGYLFILEPDLIIVDGSFPRYENKNVIRFIKDNDKFKKLNSAIIFLGDEKVKSALEIKCLSPGNSDFNDELWKLFCGSLASKLKAVNTAVQLNLKLVKLQLNLKRLLLQGKQGLIRSFPRLIVSMISQVYIFSLLLLKNGIPLPGKQIDPPDEEIVARRYKYPSLIVSFSGLAALVISTFFMLGSLLPLWGFLIGQNTLRAAPGDFVTTWETTTAGETITIPTFVGETYSYNVDCDGDGINEFTGQTGDVTCTYPTPGIHTVMISGNFPRIYFNNGGDRQKILTVEQWGDQLWTSMEDAFHGCTNLTITATDSPNLSLVTNTSEMFREASLVYQNDSINNWDVSNVSNMSGMFQGYGSDFNQDLNNWNVSSVTDMSFMFKENTVFNGDISTWDVSAVTIMSNMFWHSDNFNQDLSSWDVSSVNNMDSLFANAYAFSSDIGNWDVSSVTVMSYMFYNADSFNHNLNNWDVSNVNNMQGMFASADNFNGDISGWNVSGVTNMNDMFSMAPNFNQNIGGWDTSGVMAMGSMFNSAISFNQDISGWDTSSVTNMSAMFKSFGSPMIFNQNIQGWDTSSVTNMSQMFFYNSNFNQNLGNWDVSAVTNMSNMFSSSGLSTSNYDSTLIGWSDQALQLGVPFGTTNLSYCLAEDKRSEIITNFSWDITGDSKDCSGAFITTWKTDNMGPSGDTAFEIPTTGSGYNYLIDCDGDDIPEATELTGNYTCTYGSPGTYTVTIIGDFPRIYFNFSGDRQKLLTVEQWGDIEWTSMADSFHGCSNLTVPATDTPDLSGVTDLSGMFRDATSFNQDIGGWNTATITNMSFMFALATNFNQDLSGWDTSVVTDMSSMFYNATSFNQDLGGWDISSVIDFSEMFTGVTLSTSNYDNLLIGWEAQSPQTGIVFHGGNSNYCNGEIARADLISDFVWSITDGGKNCPSPTPTPTLVLTATPAPISTPIPTATTVPTAGPSPTPAPTKEPDSTSIPTVTVNPEVTTTPEVTAIPEVTATPEFTPTLAISPTPETAPTLVEPDNSPVPTVRPDTNQSDENTTEGTIFTNRSIELIAPDSPLREFAYETVTFGRQVSETAAEAVNTVIVFTPLALTTLSYPGGFLYAFGMFLRRKEKRPWGIIYDFNNFTPVAFARVLLYSGKEMIGSTVSDLQGRYGMVIDSGSYKVESIHAEYIPITRNIEAVKTEELIHLDLPLTPKAEADYNSRFRFYLNTLRTNLKSNLQPIFQVIFVIGLFYSLSVLLINFNWVNLLIVIAYIIQIIVYLGYTLRKRRWGRVVDLKGKPLSKHFVRLFKKGEDQRQLDVTLTDDKGRFYLVAEPGEYMLKIDKPGFGGNKAEQFIPVKTGKEGLITGKFTI